VFARQSQIWVTKSIRVWANGTNPTAGVTEFVQRISQTAIPAPGTLAVLGLGLAGLAALRRRMQ
jgi:hypothetical protein